MATRGRLSNLRYRVEPASRGVYKLAIVDFKPYLATDGREAQYRIMAGCDNREDADRIVDALNATRLGKVPV